jgi:hypothetical protein
MKTGANPGGTVQRRRWWLLLLIIPYIALLFPKGYARATPTLLGFPFFYWYQFVWVILTSTIMGIVYFALRTPHSRDQASPGKK